MIGPSKSLISLLPEVPRQKRQPIFPQGLIAIMNFASRAARTVTQKPPIDSPITFKKLEIHTVSCYHIPVVK